MEINYVRNAWYVAAWVYELEGDKVISRTIINEPVAIYRAADGALIALEDRCCHRAYPLSLGAREGDDLRCGYHGFRFDRNGACNEIPGKTRVPASVCVKRYAIALRQSWIWVWMGNPDDADENLIPVSWSLSDEAWVSRSGFVDYQAYYELVNDNLTDLSHLSYVHTRSFGAGAEWEKDADNLIDLDRGLRLERWIIPEKSSNSSGGMLVETWQSYDYLVPGVMLMKNNMYPPGTADKVGLSPPPHEAMFQTCSWQAITPMTDTTSRYFFGIAVMAGEGADMLADRAKEFTLMAFEEDRVTIEAQFRNLELTGYHMKLAGNDMAPVKFRRLLARMTRAEADKDHVPV